MTGFSAARPERRSVRARRTKMAPAGGFWVARSARRA